MSEQNKEIAIAELMMKNIKEFGLFSYELEEKREQSLLNQSTQMVTAFSVFSLAVFTILPIIKDIPRLSFTKLLFCAGIVTLFLLISLIFAVLVQWRFKYLTMQGVDEFYRSVYNEQENYMTQPQFDTQWKEQIQQIHKSKKDINDKRASWIKVSMIFFFLSIVVLVLSTLVLTLITI